MTSIDEVDQEQTVCTSGRIAHKSQGQNPWNNVAAVCRYDPERHIQLLQYYRNGEPLLKKERPINLRKRIGFIGNAKSGKEPFGVVADLRIFPHALTQRQVQELSFLRHARDPNMPDNHLVKFLEEGIP